ncbi:Stf0 family sulfotransferase [Methylobacterium symbioticum]|uniref:Trehalose 2-sulfotransferase n=1 Tax=Methylobacterium symbioticum TaxID=2584084 RepID=A0A509EBP4_9HYPH|nr:Stf0 family sulfotransferase [Methylobacterium symbioticum]VUD71667.1 Trehalose 2-sulfotransferase [Methylobacterium symbioticum]
MRLIARLLSRGTQPASQPTTERDAPATRGYAVCGAPRSGSNYFCEVLSSTGVLGHPREYFNGAVRRQRDDPTYPDDPQAQIGRILTMGATPNGVYALKLFPGLFDTVAPHLKLTEALPNLTFVRLRRDDVLGQAISWVRSIQSRQFRSTEAAQGEIRYDAETIRLYVGQVCQRNARWDMFFARTGIAPLTITYEDLASDPQQAVGRVADALGISPRPRIASERVHLRVQRDNESRAWRERFIAECGDRNYIDSADLLARTL